MEFIMDYWYIILATMAIVTVGVVFVVRFAKLPSDKQLEQVREWLLFAVIEAEKMFGSHSGKLKLRYVYDLFVGKFPWLAKIISFELFSDLVDDALEEMRELLNKNDTVAEYVAGVTND
jgi:hypothetical protein